MPPLKGFLSCMASHLIKQFTFIFVLFFIINFSRAEIESTKKVVFKQGDEFTLKAYEDHPSVYIRIEDVIDHQFLGKYYFISFHGICLGAHPNLKTSPANQGIDEIPMSHESLMNSIANTKIDKSNSLKCERKLDFDLDEQKLLVLRGGRGIMLDPISDKKTLGIYGLQHLKIMHN